VAETGYTDSGEVRSCSSSANGLNLRRFCASHRQGYSRGLSNSNLLEGLQNTIGGQALLAHSRPQLGKVRLQ